MTSSSDSKIEIAKYFMSGWWAICEGSIDKLMKIIINDKVAWDGTRTTNGTISIDKQELFGGPKREGGLLGNITFYRGTGSQTINADDAAAIGRSGVAGPYPSHRGIASLFFRGTPALGGNTGFYWRSNYPSVPSIKAQVQRKPVGLNSDFAMIPDLGNPDNIEQANPIHIAYEVMTDMSLGIGMPDSAFDVDHWNEIAEVVYDERIGISLLWTDQMDGEAFVNKLLSYVNALRFLNPMTGLEDIRLIRGGYSTVGLFEINPGNATLSSFQRKMWGDTINEIIVTWTNPKNEQTESVSVQDLANISMQGGIVSQTVDYPGVRWVSLAKKLGMRDLRVASNPLASCKATLDRSAWGILPGDVVKVTWPEHGMTEVLMRVIDVDYGDDSDSSIGVNLIEDVFGLDAGAYFESPESEWLDEDIEPRSIEHSAVLTLPYYMVVRRMPTFKTLEDPEVRVAVLGADSSVNISQFLIAYETARANGSTYWQGVETRTLLSYSTSTLSIDHADTNIYITVPTTGHGIEENTIAMLGEDEATQEMCLVTAIGSNYITVRRGMMDTTPKPWPVDTPIWFLNNEADIMDDVIRVGGQPITYRLRTMTALGTLPITSAPDLDAVLSRRHWLPLRPANCKVNADGYGPVNAPAATSLSLTWANRNRLSEDNVLLNWTSGNTTPEVGQTTTITVRNAAGTTVIQTVDGLTGSSHSLSTSGFPGTVIIKFTAKNAAGDESLQGHEITVNL
jgi:hypothetical protein